MSIVTLRGNALLRHAAQAVQSTVARRYAAHRHQPSLTHHDSANMREITKQRVEQRVCNLRDQWLDKVEAGDLPKSLEEYVNQKTIATVDAHGMIVELGMSFHLAQLKQQFFVEEFSFWLARSGDNIVIFGVERL